VELPFLAAMGTVTRLLRDKQIRAILGLPLGLAVMILIGAPLLLACTEPGYSGCLAHAYGPIGAVILLVAGGFAVVGFASLLAYRGKEVPRKWGRQTPGMDPALEARAERSARFAFVAIIAAVLSVAEAVPLYSVVQLEGFDPVFTTVDILFYAVADVIVLFLVYLWTGID
jgi:hypothetical protein